MQRVRGKFRGEAGETDGVRSCKEGLEVVLKLKVLHGFKWRRVTQNSDLKKSLWWLPGEQTGEKSMRSVGRPADELLWKSRQEMVAFKSTIVMGEIERSG